MWVTLSMLSLSDLHNTVVVVVVSDVDHEKAGECNKVFTNVTHYVLSAHPICTTVSTRELCKQMQNIVRRGWVGPDQTQILFWKIVPK